jgi:DNA-binding IscR family transcriptional regulator
MAVNVSAWVWTLDLTPYEKMIMLELADHANTKGECWPKQGTIAKRTNIHRGTVNRLLRKLERMGLLTQEQRRRNGFQRASMYRLSIGTVLYLSHPVRPCGVTQCDSTESPSATHSETSLETSLETSIADEPQENSDMKLSELNLQPKKSPDEIVSGMKYKDGFLTGDACAKIWRWSRSSAGDNGFQAELTNKDKKMLQNAHKRVGESFPAIVWDVMADWVDFTKHAEKTAGAFSCPINPSVAFFCKFVEAAADFSVEDEENYGVKLTANTSKPLTNTNEKKDNPSTAASIEDVQAIAEKYDL